MIKLTNEVVVSDPCYKIPTWCQGIVKDVLPGNYHSFVRKYADPLWGKRVSVLQVIHNDFLDTHLSWRDSSLSIGVDSGQCGIFSRETYRKDNIINKDLLPVNDFVLPYRDDEGDDWYECMCRFTLSEQSWGEYHGGVVSSSGIGDGSYKCLIAKHNGKVVGITIDYFMEKFPNKFLNEIQFQ
jgi:hypothetical protein